MFSVNLGYGTILGATLTVDHQEVTTIEKFHDVAAERAIGDNPFSYKGLINRIKTLYGSSVHFDNDDDYLRLVEKHGNVRNDLDPSVRIRVTELK